MLPDDNVCRELSQATHAGFKMEGALPLRINHMYAKASPFTYHLVGYGIKPSKQAAKFGSEQKPLGSHCIFVLVLTLANNRYRLCASYGTDRNTR